MARFTHFIHKPAFSTSSELVGGCAPKPLPLHLGYVSIILMFLFSCSLFTIQLSHISLYLLKFSYIHNTGILWLSRYLNLQLLNPIVISTNSSVLLLTITLTLQYILLSYTNSLLVISNLAFLICFYPLPINKNSHFIVFRNQQLRKFLNQIFILATYTYTIARLQYNSIQVLQKIGQDCSEQLITVEHTKNYYILAVKMFQSRKKNQSTYWKVLQQRVVLSFEL